MTLGPIAFSGNLIQPPSGVSSYATSFTPPGVTAYTVHIQASLNTTSGLLTWTFEAIDPRTGLPPSDPTVGFLPPDSDGIVGQGSVVFYVLPQANLPTGTQITNVASVIFDANAAINTPAWLNTIDIDHPVSKVAALPATVISTAVSTPVTVDWSGTDRGSGIVYYDIYASDNAGAFTLWQAHTGATSAIYPAQTNHTYSFYSIATDGAGNAEAAKTAPDTGTVIAGATTTTTLTASAQTLLPGQTVTLTAKVASTATGTATGNVTFTSGTTTLGMAALNGTGIATLAISTLASGTDTIQASYPGDTNFGPSLSNSLAIVVGLVPTSTTLSTSAATVNPGVAVTFSATVAPATGTGTPTGVVTFLDGTAMLGTVTLTAGKATLTTSALTASAHSITAVYSGDTSFATSTSATLTETISTPGFTLGVSPATLTFPAGQTGTATIMVTPVGGFNQAVSFTCSGLPRYSTCAFAPATVTPNGAPANTTLTIATSVSGAAAAHLPIKPGTSSPAGETLAAAALLGLGAMLRLRKRLRGSLALACLVLTLSCIMASLAGCARNSFNATPAGTTSLVVTASGAGVSQTTNLTIIIQ